jgi:hypothetical protein
MNAETDIVPCSLNLMYYNADIVSCYLNLMYYKADIVSCSVNLLNSKTVTCSLTSGAGLLCPQVWDGIMCWPPTPAGKIHEQPCAEYFAGFDHQVLPLSSFNNNVVVSSASWYSKGTGLGSKRSH